MKKRLLSSCIGLLGGFIIGTLLWLFDFFEADGADHLVGLIIFLTLGCGIMAFLFPVSRWSFLPAGLKGILGYGVAYPDRLERRREDHD
ncbi:MAG TPA: hypothetical protein VGH91_11780 [Gammaproteobacteria bacterium]|jgi:hypothetical protein